MQLLPGKEAAAYIDGILHPKYQIHGFAVHLTARKISVIDPVGKLDFGGSEYSAAGKVEVATRQLRAEDKYLWWELGRESYFVECNESLRLPSDVIALIEPEDRLLRAGAWHVPVFVRGHIAPIEILLTVAAMRLQMKENARFSRVRLFRIGDLVAPSAAEPKPKPSARSRAKRK